MVYRGLDDDDISYKDGSREDALRYHTKFLERVQPPQLRHSTYQFLDPADSFVIELSRHGNRG